jgi:putative peptide zinc metalloprotease protein
VSSARGGRFVPIAGEDLEGRFLAKGDLVGYGLEPATPMLRVVVRQRDVQRVAEATRSVDVRFADDPLSMYAARVARVMPQATRTLPSPSLSLAGGGEIPLDPADPEGRRALESLFVVDLSVDGIPAATAYGTRVYARFDHGREPIAAQAYRAVRHLFHSEFDL